MKSVEDLIEDWASLQEETLMSGRADVALFHPRLKKLEVEMQLLIDTQPDTYRYFHSLGGLNIKRPAVLCRSVKNFLIRITLFAVLVGLVLTGLTLVTMCIGISTSSEGFPVFLGIFGTFIAGLLALGIFVELKLPGE